MVKVWEGLWEVPSQSPNRDKILPIKKKKKKKTGRLSDIAEKFGRPEPCPSLGMYRNLICEIKSSEVS